MRRLKSLHQSDFAVRAIRRWSLAIGVTLAVAGRAQAQGNSPWENAVTVLQTAFTGTPVKRRANRGRLNRAARCQSLLIEAPRGAAIKSGPRPLKEGTKEGSD